MDGGANQGGLLPIDGGGHHHLEASDAPRRGTQSAGYLRQVQGSFPQAFLKAEDPSRVGPAGGTTQADVGGLSTGPQIHPVHRPQATGDPQHRPHKDTQPATDPEYPTPANSLSLALQDALLYSQLVKCRCR